MSPKSLLFIVGIGMGILIFSIILHGGIPFGYDYNYYWQFTHFYSSLHGDMRELSSGFLYQFEPFSGAFFYSLTSFLGKDVLYSWGYFCIFIITGIVVSFFGKQKKYYTYGSILGIFLYYFSSIQYINFAGSLGKQLFATFFLLLAIRHVKKLIVSIPLLVACISLHRLTGLVAILFILSSLFPYKKQDVQKYIILIVAIFFAVVTYIPSFDVQILPFLRQITNPGKMFFHEGRYGAGLSYLSFWYHIFPVALLLFVGLLAEKKHIRRVRPYMFVLLMLGTLVVFRGIAYNRLESFLQLTMILLVIQWSHVYLQKKWLWAVLILQLIFWSIPVREYFLVRIPIEEYKNIELMLSKAPKNIHIVNLSHPYRAALAGRSLLDIRNTYNILTKNMTREEQSRMRYDKPYFCEKLSQLDKPTFVYSGSLDNFISEQHNPCLTTVKEWKNGARLSLFRKQITQNPRSDNTCGF